MKVDLYDVLQVSPRADAAVIKAARNALMHKLHPDEGDTLHGSRAMAINEAYAILGNQKSRAEYDAEQSADVGKVVGEYVLHEKIAEGAIGITYRAKHILTGAPVCIKHCKEISPMYTRIMLEESAAVWDLRHYALPAMRTVLQLEDGSIALVMSYVPGPTLAQVIDKVGRIEAEHVAWIAERLLNALKYMHFHGVVHGDVKPQNIIIQPDKHMCVLVDFGLSLVKPTASSASKGFTELYAPPEEMAGKPLLPESDFYSLGMTLLHALAGDPVRAKRLEIPEDTPEPLSKFIYRFIKRDVRNRPSWDEDLCDTIVEVRNQSFGRRRSEMKPIPGL